MRSPKRAVLSLVLVVAPALALGLVAACNDASLTESPQCRGAGCTCEQDPEQPTCRGYTGDASANPADGSVDAGAVDVADAGPADGDAGDGDGGDAEADASDDV